jgi:predicted acylesterase/phospholipase RssA
MGKDQAQKNTGIALCLSGGGLRATLFHLGVVRALRHLKDEEGKSALSRVSEIYSVSGGSILAAHMRLNWDKYVSGDDDEFSQVEAQIRAFATRNIRDRVLRRWLLTLFSIAALSACAVVLVLAQYADSESGLQLSPLGVGAHIPQLGWPCVAVVVALLGLIIIAKALFISRTRLLQREYESRSLLGRCTFHDIPRPVNCPSLHILTTSFRTGELCSFSEGRFEVESNTGATEASAPYEHTKCGHLRLGFAVAASSAFPPMFPPIALSNDRLGNPPGKAFQQEFRLSDGGVYDNLGVVKFAANRIRNADAPALLVMSDAGGSFQARLDEAYSGFGARNVRASDILMHRVGDLTKADIARAGGDCCTIRISNTVEYAQMDEAVQQRLRLVRTDLDRFGRPLASMLIGHGERLAIAGLADYSFSTDVASELPATSNVEAQDAIARGAAKRNFWSMFLGYDWVSMPFNLAVVLSMSALVTTITWVPRWALELKKTNDAQVTAIGAVSNDFDKVETFCKPAPCSTHNPAFAALKQSIRAAERSTARVVVRKNPPRPNVSEAFDDSTVASSHPTQSPTGPATARADAAASTKAAQATQTAQAAQAAPAGNNGDRNLKVYIQFAGDMTRDSIKTLNESLARAWRVQGTSGERVIVGYGLNEVRWSGNNQQAAKRLADHINKSLKVNKIITRNPVETKQVSIIHPDTLEIWISN